MNTKINKLKAKLEALKIEQEKPSEEIHAELIKAYSKAFGADKALQKDIKQVQEAKDYGSDDLGIYAWIRCKCTLPTDEKDREALTGYLADRFIGVDFENDALTYHQGPCLIINENGDILDEDSGKWIIDASEYTVDGEQDETKRNELIEAWMEKSGYFPGVFTQDRYGNVFLVNTIKF